MGGERKRGWEGLGGKEGKEGGGGGGGRVTVDSFNDAGEYVSEVSITGTV